MARLLARIGWRPTKATLIAAALIILGSGDDPKEEEQELSN
jgi:hypothetical protein